MSSNGSNVIQSGTAEGLLDFLDYVVVKGYAPTSAANAQKSAARQVLSMVEGENFGSLDVKGIDVDDLLSRFDVKARGQLKAESIVSYKNRAGRAIEVYREFLETGKPPSYRTVTKRKAATAPKASGSTPATENVAPEVSAIPLPSADRMVDYPFPLKAGGMAHLRLPLRLEREDAERLGAFLRTLVLEPQKQIGKGDDHTATTAS